jgi:anti-sigma28 factor (negative regulator of flagellin synthesis)
LKKPVFEKKCIWEEIGFPTKKSRSADITGEKRFSCHVAGSVLQGIPMGTKKSSDHPGHRAGGPAEKAKGKARHGKRITSASSNATLITAQVIKIAGKIKSGEVRPDRIRFIRSLLDSDAYTIDPDEIARKMLEENW